MKLTDSLEKTNKGVRFLPGKMVRRDRGSLGGGSRTVGGQPGS